MTAVAALAVLTAVEPAARAGVAVPGPPPLATADDPQADEGWISPTALTQPAGTVTVSDHELLWMTATYAPHDRLQLSLRGVPPITAKNWIGALTAKLRVVDVEHAQIAVFLGGGLGAGSGDIAGHFLTAGAVATVCANGCRALGSFYVLVNPIWASSSPNVTRYFYGGNLVAVMVAPVKVVAEVNLLGEDWGTGSTRPDGTKVFLGVLGLRFHGRRFAVTAGVMFVFAWSDHVNTEDHDEQFILPAGSITGRFGGP